MEKTYFDVNLFMAKKEKRKYTRKRLEKFLAKADNKTVLCSLELANAGNECTVINVARGILFVFCALSNETLYFCK